MERTGISAEERTGLAVAVVLHLALFAMLIVQGLFPGHRKPRFDRADARHQSSACACAGPARIAADYTADTAAGAIARSLAQCPCRYQSAAAPRSAAHAEPGAA